MWRLLALCLLAFVAHIAFATPTVADGVDALAQQRYREALGIFVPLANGGDSEAQRRLGEMAYKGQGVKKNLQAAFKWTELAAQGGDRIAMYNLGYLYERGEGAPKNQELAIEWYTRSAVQNYSEAQYKLGLLNESQNRQVALGWYEKAYRQGHVLARERFSALGNTLAEEQRAADAREDTRRYTEKQEEDAKERQRSSEAKRDPDNCGDGFLPACMPNTADFDRQACTEYRAKCSPSAEVLAKERQARRQEALEQRQYGIAVETARGVANNAARVQAQTSATIERARQRAAQASASRALRAGMADPDVTPPDRSHYVPGDGTNTANKKKGHWKSAMYRITAWGSPNSMVRSTYVYAGITCADGSGCFEGGYIKVSNGSGEFNAKVQSSEIGTVQLAPHEQRMIYLPIYRSQNDHRPTQVDLTVTWWVED